MPRPKTFKFERKIGGIVSASQSCEHGLEHNFSFNAEQDCVRMMEVFLSAARHGNEAARNYAAKLIEFRQLQGRMPSKARPDSFPLYSAAVRGAQRPIQRESLKLTTDWKKAAISQSDELYYLEGAHNGILRDTSEVLKAYYDLWFADDDKVAKMQTKAREGGCIDITDSILLSPQHEHLFEGEFLRSKIEEKAGRKMKDEYRPPCFSFSTDNVLKFRPRTLKG